MTDQDAIDSIIDATGELRRLGSMCRPAGFVCSAPVFEDTFTVWDDRDIKRVITDQNRTPNRQRFGRRWILNQRNKGSCNGFAGAGGLQRARWLRGIRDGLLLSGAYLYSLINGGRDRGSMLDDGMREIENGLPPDSLVTWDMIYPNLQPRNAKEEAAKHKADRCFAAKTMQGFRSGIAAGFMGVVAVHVGSRYQRLDRYGVGEVDDGPGNHAVCVDDMVILPDGREVFDSPGSWGPDAGVDGRWYFMQDSFRQTFNNHTFYLIPTSVEG